MSNTNQLIQDKEGLDYWRANAEEDYMKVPISVLRYISELESAVAVLTDKEAKRAIQDTNPKIPHWITDADIQEIKRLWKEPNIDNSNPRVQAVKMIMKKGNCSIKEANEILHDCLEQK